MRSETYLVLDTAGLHLVREDLGAGLLGLGLVDVLHENTLVLEDVTLRLLVQRVVPLGGGERSCEGILGHREKKVKDSQVLINLARLPVLPQQPTENPLPPHPLDLGGHTGIGGTLPLTGASVATLALGGEEVAGAGARVDGGGLDDNAAVLDELLYVGAGVGVADLSLLVRIEPDFSLADASDGCGEALLGPEVDHGVCTGRTSRTTTRVTGQTKTVC